MHCKSCAKVIDDEVKLRDIFKRIYSTLYSNSQYTKEEFDNEYDCFKVYEPKNMSNNDYYKELVEIVFYSGFRAATVEKHLPVIHSYFGDYKEVAKYNIEKLQEIKNDRNMIQNKNKIDACFKNARKIEQIVEQFGSVEKYINSFTPNKSDECLFRLKDSLEKNFSYIGGTTSYHFMTEIGLNVLKPDIVNLRIFYRLGLLDDKKDLFGAVKIGRSFSRALNLSIKYIDIIFVTYGQLNLEKLECICSEKNPKCLKCGANIYCNYAKTSSQG